MFKYGPCSILAAREIPAEVLKLPDVAKDCAVARPKPVEAPVTFQSYKTASSVYYGVSMTL